MDKRIKYLGGEEKVNEYLSRFDSQLRLIKREEDCAVNTLSVITDLSADSDAESRIKATLSNLLDECNENRAKQLDLIAKEIGQSRLSAIMLSKIHQSKQQNND